MLSNATGISNCSYLYGSNKLKVLSLVSATTILDTNAWIHKNDYLSMIESYDNKNITFDINEPYRNTITSLSSIFCRQSDFITLQNTLTSVSSLSSNYTTITQTSVLNNTLNTYIHDQNIRNATYANQTEVETFYNSLPDLFYTQTQSDSLYLSSSLYNTFQPRIHNTISGAISVFNESTNKIKTFTLSDGISVYNPDNTIIYQNDYLKMIELTDSVLIDLKPEYFSNLYYNKIQSDALYLSSSLYGAFQQRLSNASDVSMSLLNQTTSKIKNLSLLGGITTIINNNIIHQNNYLSYTDDNTNNITLDLKSDYRHTTTTLSNLFLTKTGATDIYQPIISNASNNPTGAYMLYNNKIKNLSLVNGVNSLSVGDGSIIHSNTYLSILESNDNTNITLDIDATYLNTTTTLSTLYYRQSTMNSILTSNYQPLISTNSTLSFSKGILGGSTTNTAVLNIKGSTTTIPALALYSGASNPPVAASTFYSGQYNDITLAPGDWGGCVRANNLVLYNAITIGNGAANTTLLTPGILKNILCKQATSTFPSGVYFGLDITSCYNSGLPGLTFVVNPGSQRCIHVEGILALLISNLQFIFTNLKTAGIAGFTTY